MIPVLSRIVENRTVGTDDNLLQRHVFVRRAGNQLVQVVHVSTLVLAVVVLDGLLAHPRSQRVFRIGKLW